MQTVHASPFTRDDTLFGVCQALGEDFGFNPFLLRLALGVGLIWQPVAVIAGYFGVGIVLMLIHWLVPTRRAAKADAPATETALVAPAPAEALPLAA